VVSWVKSSGDNRTEAEIASFDVTLAAPDGTICVEVKGFSIRRMEDVSGFGVTAQDAPTTNVTHIDQEAMRPLSPAEERLRHNLSQGIRSDEGADLFLRALSDGYPQVILSSLDLNALITQAAQTDTDEQEDGQKFQRPQLDSDYVAPENAIEERLAALPDFGAV